MSFTILGAGMALPRFGLSNEKLCTMLDTTDEWITTRTGIKNRFISTDETLTDLAVKAAKQAIANSKTNVADLDLIICSTIGGEYLTPSLGCMVQKSLGATCPAFDINAACTGFIYGLDLASAYFASGKAKKILLVSAEMMSDYVDWTDRNTCVLFGDGSGAVVLEAGDNLLAIRLTAVGNETFLSAGGVNGNNPFSQKELKQKSFYMNGQEVFKFAVQAMCKDIRLIVEEAGVSLSDIKKIIPHQANIRIINSAKERLKLKEDQLVCGVDRYGNTSSASIPILLAELLADKTLVKGDLIVLAAFGGGLTTGACLIKI